MKKVILVNRKNCSNIGDQAINASFNKFLSSRFDVAVCCEDYTVLGGAPKGFNIKSGKLYYLRQLIKRALPLNLIWFLINGPKIYLLLNRVAPDLVVIGGGQLFLPGRFSMAAFSWVFFARLKNIKVVFSNVGIGGGFSFVDRFFLKYALSNCDGVCVRGSDSKQMLLDIFGNDYGSVVSADIVFTNDFVVRGDGVGRCLIGVADYQVYNTYNKKLSRFEYYEKWISFLTVNDISLSGIFLIYTTSEDYFESLRFKDYLLKYHDIGVQMLKYRDLEGFEASLSKADLVVSGRMHALIIASNHGCSIKAFPISNKVIDFERQLLDEGFNVLSCRAKNTTFTFLEKYL